MSGINVEFKFEIGGMVYFRGSIHDFDHRPNQFVIAERSAHECHGGLQRLYKLVNYRDPVPEIALSREEPSYQPASDAAYKERRKKNAVDSEIDGARWENTLGKAMKEAESKTDET